MNSHDLAQMKPIEDQDLILTAEEREFVSRNPTIKFAVPCGYTLSGLPVLPETTEG